MINVEKLLEEFTIFANALLEMKAHLSKSEWTQGAFIAGLLYARCQNHIVNLTPLIPLKPAPAEEAKEEAKE